MVEEGITTMGEAASNFDFLRVEPRYEQFAKIARAAESVLVMDTGSAIINCRRALECAVRWIYSVDKSLPPPWDDRLVSLVSTTEFRAYVGENLSRRIDYIRKMGNKAAHTDKELGAEMALLCLKNLHIFLSCVGQSYSPQCKAAPFDAALAKRAGAAAKEQAEDAAEAQPSLEELLKQNAALQAELTAMRAKQPKPDDVAPREPSEYATRKLYIDAMLMDAGWEEKRDWYNEVELPGMPNKAGVGYADYVLYSDAGQALAVIEAKKTCVGVEKGRQQAKLYADILEKQQGFRPVVFLTNGFETRLIDNRYKERIVSGIYSKRDLEKHFNIQRMRCGLGHVMVDRHIAGRYYQEAAIKAVCESFDRENRRKALLVMATGSGKTRTVIALCKILMEQGWVKNILFLADRTALVEQAKRAFTNMLPEVPLTNLCEEKDNTQARCVFSTYNTMMNCIDTVKDENGKVFTCGHFDLLICDEAHRSIYNKYKAIFNYFDAPLVGLTATPKDQIDKNTYEIFDLEDRIPTYGYDLQQAVKDGYLVDFVTIETVLKFMQEGITYDQLSERDRERYEETFTDDEGNMPESIDAAALNSWVFNEDTIRQVLNLLMQKGLRVDYGNRLGKTIIFAKNHAHAEKILEVFGKEYPNLPGYAKVIDNYINYAQTAIDEFSEADKQPHIAITVDMLDTGIDVPEVLNLVFFKKVRSLSKFWQMIGRGTRLCPGLMSGTDKEKFHIFDFCGNFEFFRINKGQDVPNTLPIQGALFGLKARMAEKLQDIAYQTEELRAFRERLVQEMLTKVQVLNRQNFAVRLRLELVEKYSRPETYLCLNQSSEEIREIAPLIQPDDEEASALSFDNLLYGVELAYLEEQGKGIKRGIRELRRKVSSIAGVANIPEIYAQKELIDKIIHTQYLENAGMSDFELIRESLRGLMKYLPRGGRRYDTNFEDEVLVLREAEYMPEDDTLLDYRAKAESYLRKHQDQGVIAKLKHNIPLSADDVRELERILWREIGTKEAYEQVCCDKPLGEFVREIIGLDMAAAKKAFAQFLDTTRLDSLQIYFVNQVVEYIVQNGMMKDFAVLQQAPFNNQGSIADLFPDLSLWGAIRKTIERITANAGVA